MENEKAAAQHTPGPWFNTRFKGVNYRITKNAIGGGEKIAQLIPNEANACLIAAAPDLLEALRGLLGFAAVHATPGVRDNYTLACEQARAALAKAGV